MSAPDFIGVGAQRAGVAWWLRLLVDHPAVRAPRRRQQHFFDDFYAREMQSADVAGYHRRFRPRRGGIAGEWTPSYMSDAWVPLLLHRAAPDARLLALVRDPVERFRAAVAPRLGSAPIYKARVIVADAIERGRYASQLRRLLEFYERDRILVLQYERCRRDPAGEYARTLRFLGVADDVRPPGLERREEEPVGPALWPDLEADVRAALEPEVRGLQELVPDLDLALWPSFAAR